MGDVSRHSYQPEFSFFEKFYIGIQKSNTLI